MPTVTRDGRSWTVGTQDEVAWIQDGTEPGLTIRAAVPPVFAAYATLVIVEDDDARVGAETLLLDLLVRRSGAQPWWLGYLDTGAHDVVFPAASRVTLYTDWAYVLVQAGAAEAGTWRADDPWRGRLPDLIFPADRSWLLSMMWDDDWRCLGGPAELVSEVLAEPRLSARGVGVADPDVTPPGHQYY